MNMKAASMANMRKQRCHFSVKSNAVNIVSEIAALGRHASDLGEGLTSAQQFTEVRGFFLQEVKEETHQGSR
jgi:hypothetical protein